MRRTLVTGVVLVLALGACGRTSETASKVSTLQLVAGAAAKASDAKTAKVTMTMSLPVAGKTRDISIDGAVDFRNGAVEMSMDMSSFGVGAPDGSIALRMVDGVLYMDMGDMLQDAGELPAGLRGKHWFKVTMGDAAGSAAAQQQNPADLLQSLRGAGEVEELGTATIHGAHTTHFRARIDLRKAIAGLDKSLADRLRGSMSIFKGNEIPIDVWIGDDGLPRRETLSVSVGSESTQITMDFFDFGVDVDIAAPPADEVADLSELTDLAKGLSDASTS